MKQDKIAYIRNFLVQKMKVLHKSANDTIFKLKMNEDKFADPVRSGRS